MKAKPRRRKPSGNVELSVVAGSTAPESAQEGSRLRDDSRNGTVFNRSQSSSGGGDPARLPDGVILRLEDEIPAEELPVLPEVREQTAAVGSFTMVLGNPYGGDRFEREPFMTWGLLSARGQIDPARAAYQTELDGLRQPGIDLVMQDDPEQGLEQAGTLEPQLVIVGMEVGLMEGLEFLAFFMKRYPDYWRG